MKVTTPSCGCVFKDILSFYSCNSLMIFMFVSHVTRWFFSERSCWKTTKRLSKRATRYEIRTYQETDRLESETELRSSWSGERKRVNKKERQAYCRIARCSCIKSILSNTYTSGPGVRGRQTRVAQSLWMLPQCGHSKLASLVCTLKPGIARHSL